jgi:hypothetical protein
MPTHTRQSAIDRIRRLPAQIAELTAPLTAEQLTTHYLAGEWTVAQNVHHLADSHMHSYIRCKLILTEEQPTLKPYDQDLWADMIDASQVDLAASLALLQGLHVRWVTFWESLHHDAWARTGVHPERGEISLESILYAYAGHGEEHIDQIQRTLAAESHFDWLASTARKR